MDLFFAIGTVNYGYKVLAAFALIPAIYALRWGVKRYLGEAEARALREAAAAD
jgi:hypothetical protein